MIKGHLLYIKKQIFKCQEFENDYVNHQGIGGERSKVISLDPLVNSVVLIDGQCMEIILADKYLKAHFIFILALVKKVIAFNFNQGNCK